jgi:hypothetical protein
MRNKNILIRVSEEELDNINSAYKQFLIGNDLISRSEFIRRMVLVGAEGCKNGK